MSNKPRNLASRPLLNVDYERPPLESAEGELHKSNYWTRATADNLPVDDLTYSLFTIENVDVIREALADEIKFRTGLEITPEAQDRKSINKVLFNNYQKYQRSCLYFKEDRPLEDHIAIINLAVVEELTYRVIMEMRELETYTKWRDNVEVRAVQIYPVNTKHRKAPGRDLHEIGFYGKPGGHQRVDLVPLNNGLKSQFKRIVDWEKKYEPKSK